ncbi:BlaI/MecI/CopY family transcriptional regulator [Fusibacter sp. 3D3]|uniref:BlaI/MecI/CopY family transcriptional regulator n=1 Tax=Fusibacter sp. 3D3 TaxID=1048380 RepID=UPI000858BA83|nr:BlaI/MecI/CopY family transcriptional regulator [Fusibacter sp. 3D3]GAU79678.1 beta-lactamase repressor BlaI [Fusibacter sp. 3D3]
MEPIKLFDSELKIMDILWREGKTTAKQICLIAATEIGWNKNTTYTVIKKLIDKNAVCREDPGFVCSALISLDEVQKDETERLIDKLWGGSKKAFFSAFIDEQLSEDEIAELRTLIEKK